MDPYDYAKKKAAASGSSFYYSFLFLAPKERRAITALYALCRELDDAADANTPEIARTKLAWWHGELLRLFSGCPEHPVSKALLPAITEFQLPKIYFDELLRGMQYDAEFKPFENFNALTEYCYRVAGVVGILSCYIFGMTDSHSLKFAEHLGLSLQLINITRDVGEDLRRGRNYLPLDWLNEAEIDLTHVLQQKDATYLQPLLNKLAEKARESFRNALATLPSEKRFNARAALIMADIYFSLLDEIEAENFNVLHQRIALTPLRKLLIAWKAYRREKKIQHKAHSH